MKFPPVEQASNSTRKNLVLTYNSRAKVLAVGISSLKISIVECKAKCYIKSRIDIVPQAYIATSCTMKASRKEVSLSV